MTCGVWRRPVAAAPKNQSIIKNNDPTIHAQISYYVFCL
jgi:hypothetical protein